MYDGATVEIPPVKAWTGRKVNLLDNFPCFVFLNKPQLKAEVAVTVSSFPEPQIMWHLNSNKMVLRPGESADNGEYRY